MGHFKMRQIGGHGALYDETPLQSFEAFQEAFQRGRRAIQINVSGSFSILA